MALRVFRWLGWFFGVVQGLDQPAGAPLDLRSAKHVIIWGNVFRLGLQPIAVEAHEYVEGVGKIGVKLA